MRFNLALMICLLLSLAALAKSPTIIFNDSLEIMSIGKYVSILEDKTNQLTYEDVVNSKDFKPSTQEVPNLGISSSTFWIGFEIRNVTEQKLNLLLELGLPTYDKVSFFSKKHSLIKDDGEKFPFSYRKYKNPNYLYDINLNVKESIVYYIRLECSEQILIPLSIGQKELIYERLHKKNMISGMYAGIIVIMLVYNLFLYLAIKDFSYLYYIVYVLFMGLTHLTIHGYTFQFLWPNNPSFAQMSTTLFSSLVGVTAILFVQNFLKTKNNKPRIHYILNILISTFLICVILIFFDKLHIAFQLMQLTTTVSSLYVLYVGYYIWKKGYKPAMFFLIAWSILLSGAIIYLLKDFGLLPYNTATNYTMLGVSSVEIALLSFALADRINIFKREKEEAQARELQERREKQDILTNMNKTLQQKVSEKTKSLQHANKELKGTLLNLKETQSQMVALGESTASIAHDIKNPVSYIKNSVILLRGEIDCEKPNWEEVKELVNYIEHGSTETLTLVKELKNFSYADEGQFLKTDISESIETAILLLKNQIKEKSILITKNFELTIDLYVIPSKLNLVLINLIENAIHAVDKNGEIQIQTQQQGEIAIITITDNGAGMNNHIKDKIFEPLFTTKERGVGTGLGLATVKKIIEKHKGSIRVTSEVGVRTEFIIKLPTQ